MLAEVSGSDTHELSLAGPVVPVPMPHSAVASATLRPPPPSATDLRATSRQTLSQSSTAVGVLAVFVLVAASPSSWNRPVSWTASAELATTSVPVTSDTTARAVSQRRPFCFLYMTRLNTLNPSSSTDTIAELG